MKRSRPRKTANLSESVYRQLNSYALAASAAGVGVLALAQPTEAKIVYTPANVILDGSPFPIDLNKDGIVDFFLIKYAWHGSSAYGLSACQYVITYGEWGPFCYQKSGANAIRATESNKWATDLRSGAVIKAGDRFNRGDVFLGQVGLGSGTRWSGPWMNGGKGVKSRYLGLKFKAGGRFHFGWARITVKTVPPPQGFTAVLTGYAYETIPGKPIIAGATKGTDDNNIEQPDAALTSPVPDSPQPATLGALALGAPGLSIWRRDELADAPR